jgi:hypothetical protein
MVGGTRQRVNQILGDFADEGLVMQDNAGLIIKDVEGLRRRSDW